MAFIDWPEGENQTRLAYNLLIISALVGTSAWAQYFNDWVPFAITAFIIAFIVYDLYVVPVLQASEISEEVTVEEHLVDWMGDQSMARVDKLEKEIKGLKRGMKNE